jgi:hypothetical protein
MSAAAILLLLVLSGHASADTFGSGDNSFGIEFVTIGDPGNADDTVGSPRPGGSVEYVYRIGEYEISRDMVDKANREGNLGIVLNTMTSVTGGPRSDMAAAGMSWNEGARFVNWLNISEGFLPAYKFATQPGDAGYNANFNNNLLWQADDPGFDATNRFRNRQARYVLPSVDEWHKAAFYDPNVNGGTGGYWNYPTGSDSVPTPVTSGTDVGTAVYNQSLAQGPADITQAGGRSPYGVMAMAGNTQELEETTFDLLNKNVSGGRGVRSGRWNKDASFFSASFRGGASGNTSTPGGSGNMGIRVASIPEPPPLETISLSGPGDMYVQNFDEALGIDGSAVGATFPTAWIQDGHFYANRTTAAFPIGGSLESNSTFNAGAENDSDRALAFGVKDSSDQHFLQLLAAVTEADANSFQLQFDVEAWDSKDGFYVPQIDLWTGLPDDPGEAAFNVKVDMDTGAGFTPLVDLGTVTTGPTLQRVQEGIVDGNADANRISFDSGVISAAIPVGARLRIRWASATEAETRGWVFGLDNVALSLLDSDCEPGDFNCDFVFDVADIDLLTSEIVAETHNSSFDVTGDGVVDDADVTAWLSDAAEHNGFSEAYLAGDSNLDGSVDSIDLNNLALNWRRDDVARWSAGDFTVNGSVGSDDLNELALNWRNSIPMASAAPVPEPSALLLALVGLGLAWRRPRRT